MASKRTRIIGVVVVAIVLLSVLGLSVTKDRRNRVVVQTQKAALADLVSTVTASGEVKPKRFVNVSANISGRITHLYVVEGQTVKKGTGTRAHRLDPPRGGHAPVGGRRCRPRAPSCRGRRRTWRSPSSPTSATSACTATS